MSKLLLSSLLSLIDKNSIIHIHSRYMDTVQRVQDAIEDRELDGLVVRSAFVSALDCNSIGIVLYDSIKLSKEEIETYEMKFHEDPTISIKFLVEELHFGAREFIVRTNSSYVFVGNSKEFINCLECYKNRNIISLKRLHIGESERNTIEIVVEEEMPRLKIRHILSYLYTNNQVSIMDWNGSLIYRGSVHSIKNEILDRYIDKLSTTYGLPNHLIIRLKHK